MKKSKQPPQANPKNALLGDLESIRTLLDEEAETTDDDGLDVPLLDDVVDGSLGLHEVPLNDSLVFDPSAKSALDDELFAALLGDSWKQSTEAILERTRERIERNRNQWAPQDTDELNEALKVRIDSALRKWLKRLVLAHIEELRAELLEAAGAALEYEMTRRLESGNINKNDKA